MVYFNRMNRENHFLGMILWERLSTWAEDQRCQLTKDELRWVRSACTFIRKASDSIVIRMGNDYAEKFLADLRNSAIEVVRSTRITDQSVTVETDELYDLADYALCTCQREPEQKCGTALYKKCRVYETLWNLNIPVATEETDYCPYRL